MIWAIGCILFVTSIDTSLALKCYQCQSTAGSCVEEQCLGAWCVAIMTDDKATGTHKMEKMCAQANPAASGIDGCAKENQGSTTVTKCGCQIEEFCNGDAGLARLMADKSSQLGAGPPNLAVEPPVQPAGVILGNQSPLPFGQIQTGVSSGPNQVQPVNLPPHPINPNFINALQPVNGAPNANLPTQNGNPNINLAPFSVPAGNDSAPPRFPVLPGAPENSNSNFGSSLGAPPQGSQAGAPLNNQFSSFNSQQQPISRLHLLGGLPTSAVPEPEPALKNATQPPSFGSPLDSISKKPQGASNLPKYMCRCEGPMDCKNEKCTDEYCSMIEIDMRDLSHPGGRSGSPGSPNNPNQPSGHQPTPQIVKHFGCMSSQGLNGAQIATNKMYPLPYKMLIDGKQTTVTSNQQFCTGDFCNFASKTISMSFALLFVCLSFAFMKS